MNDVHYLDDKEDNSQTLNATKWKFRDCGQLACTRSCGRNSERLCSGSHAIYRLLGRISPKPINDLMLNRVIMLACQRTGRRRRQVGNRHATRGTHWHHLHVVCQKIDSNAMMRQEYYAPFCSGSATPCDDLPSSCLTCLTAAPPAAPPASRQSRQVPKVEF